MILQSLVELYRALERDGKVTGPGWSNAKVAAELDIGIDGKLLGVVSLKIPQQRGKKTVENPQNMKVPEQVTRSSGVAPNYLCDNSSYFLGIDKKGKPERTKKCFEEAKKMHLKYLENVHSDAAVAVKAFFQYWDPEKAAENPIVAAYFDELCEASNLVFYYEGEYVQNDAEIKDAWEFLYQSKDGGPKGVCLVTGEHTSIARIHSMIKGVPGAQSSGASLIGFNAPAFQSYGKEQSYNAPVGEYAVYAYTTALNYLINEPDQKTRTVFGNTMIVYWAENGEECYQEAFSDVIEPTTENQEEVQGVFENLKKGWAVDTEGVLSKLDPNQKFYILGITPNAARLAVRFFYMDSFGNILKHLAEHYKRMGIVRPSWDEISYLGAWRMMQEITNKKTKDKKPPDNVSGNVLRAILSGDRYPEILYQTVLQRIRADQDNADSRIYKITRGRVAIIKAYLMKNTQITEKEEITVGLNENCKNVPYNLGRMFAVLEHIQEESSDNKINATIKDRYFNSACATPASIFPLLLKLKNSHMRKIGRKNKGAEVRFEQILGVIQDNISVSDDQIIAYPNRLSLEEQGMFILGYYHQTQKRYEKKTEEAK